MICALQEANALLGQAAKDPQWKGQLEPIKQLLWQRTAEAERNNAAAEYAM